MEVEIQCKKEINIEIESNTWYFLSPRGIGFQVCLYHCNLFTLFIYFFVIFLMSQPPSKTMLRAWNDRHTTTVKYHLC